MTTRTLRALRAGFMRDRLRGLLGANGNPWPHMVTIFGARYGGAYEGAPWIAWIGDVAWLDDYQAGDNDCESFCDDYVSAPIGRGNSPQAALDHLVRLAMGASGTA